MDFGDADGGGDALGGGGAVAGEHDGSQGEALDAGGGGGFDGVVDIESEGVLAVDGGGDGEVGLDVEPGAAADFDVMIFYGAFGTLAGGGEKLGNSGEGGGRVGHDSLSERVFGGLFDSGDGTKPLPIAFEAGDDGAAFGESAGLIEDGDIDAGEALHGFAALEEHSKARGPASGHHDRRRDSQAHGTGTCNDQHCDGRLEGKGDFPALQHPGGKREDRERNDDGDEDGADAVGEALKGRFRGLRFAGHADNLAEHGAGTDGGGAELKRSGAVEGTGRDVCARGFGDGEGFAREHRFIDGGRAGFKRAIDGDAFGGLDEEAVAEGDGIDGDGDPGVVAAKPGGGGSELGEFADGFGGLMAGAGFHGAASEDEAENEDDGFEVDVVDEAGEASQGVSKRSAGAEGDERAHVGVAVAKAAERFDVILASGAGHDVEGEGELDPVPRGVVGVADEGHGGHHDEADGDADGGGAEGFVLFMNDGLVAVVDDGFDERGGVGEGGVEDDGGLVRQQADSGTLHAGNFFEGMLNVALAGGAGHAADGDSERRHCAIWEG